VCYRNLDKAEDRLEKLNQALKEVDARVAELRNRFEKRTTEAAQLKLELDKANETIAAAESLVGKLGGEHRRWNEQVSYQPKDHLLRLVFHVTFF